MRYEDWDILLFPRDSKNPVKEFKVACHVVHDPEFSHTHGSGVPTVCCFVPSLAAGAPFKVSIHSWSPPSTSQYTKSYGKIADNVKFEARLFIDGRLIASAALEQSTDWPHVMSHSFGLPQNGELEFLKFPPFRRELLQQSFWNPADDLGRIKLVISEGFPRDSMSLSIERVKNIVTFSFQHAPLDILESSCIAWPNPSMWRRQALVASSMVVPTCTSNDVTSHAHSPRHQADLMQSHYAASVIPTSMVMPKSFEGLGPRRATLPVCSTMAYAKAVPSDAFGDTNAYFEWLNGMGMSVGDVQRAGSQAFAQHRNARRSSTDISMPDYTPMELSEGLTDQQSMLAGMRQDEDDSSGHLRVPTNTPTASGHGGHQELDGAERLPSWAVRTLTESLGVPYPMLSLSSSMPADLTNSLTNSLLNQPMSAQFQRQQQQQSGLGASEVKSRKENRRHQAAAPSPPVLAGVSGLGQEQQEMRRVSQQMYIASGSSLPVCMTAEKQDVAEMTSMAGGEGNKTEADQADKAADKGCKRMRNLTPTIKDEGEMRRGSPVTSRTPITHDLTGDDDDN
ncbi:hypothetical protein CDD80_1541 [Ophiocordyceps camponoti-rufipedis]|uniref:Uncharacterized protein n=1 Tax=Ophiocordyceps camponoti-rufipedis TaxID=2004952 RepID=A0A2C5Z9P7_9HYPO|nr:hypothetical protein CDD80_1541 [Ophiocordyceps camponoti-rufipedis]